MGPTRRRGHFLLDHLDRNDCLYVLLLPGICDREHSLADLAPCGRIGDAGGSCALHVHARVLGASARVAHCVQVRGLDHHCPTADDRVQPDLEGCTKARVCRHVLEVVARNLRHAGLRLRRRDWCPGGECSQAVKEAFNNMRFIVTVGWSIYPLGYFFGYLLGTVDQTFLNVLYNVADFINKIAFVLACWSAAKSETK